MENRGRDGYYDAESFKYRLKVWKIFRRSMTKGSSYYFRTMVNQKRRTVCLREHVRSKAVSKCKKVIGLILDESWSAAEDYLNAGIVQGRLARELKKGRKYATIGEVVERYLGGASYVRNGSAQTTVQALVRLLSQTYDIERDAVLNLSTESLNYKTVRKYQAMKQERENVNYSITLPGNTSANSTLRCAKAMFSRRSMSKYDDLSLPACLGEEFLKAAFLKTGEKPYSSNPVPKSAILKMNKALPALKKDRPELWLINRMLSLMGLRSKEVIYARKSWIIERGKVSYLGIRAIEGEYDPKRQEGDVPIPASLLKEFEKADDYLLGGTEAERKKWVSKDHSQWLRQFIPDRNKSNHELRKHAGSVVATKTNSWERAARFLRIDLATAKFHYLSFIDESSALNDDDLMM